MEKNKNNKINKILITGIAGSGGSYLAEYIEDNHKNIEIHGLSRWHSTTQNNLINSKKQINIHEADLNIALWHHCVAEYLRDVVRIFSVTIHNHL